MTYLPANRAELYQRLQLVDAPLTERRCYSCDTCRKRETFARDHFDAANEASAERLKRVARERADE